MLYVEDNRNYPHCCAYLWYLLQVEHLTGKEIIGRIQEYSKWFYENCRELQAKNEGQPVVFRPVWTWSVASTLVPLTYSMFKPVPSGFAYGDSEEREFPNAIYFMYKEDLLAFKLRFGINDTCENPR